LVTVVDACEIFSTTALDVLVARVALPEYMAVSECDPKARVVTESCATLLLIVAVPSDVVPSMKLIVPDAESPVGGVTVPVSVTD
jgi:hypothetical protein